MKLQHVLTVWLIVSIMWTVIGPVSKAVLLGEEANFSCTAEALGILWTINGISFVLLGIEPIKQSKDGVLTSTITVNGSAQYDNASIQCVLIISPTTTHPIPPVFLTVLGEP